MGDGVADRTEPTPTALALIPDVMVRVPLGQRGTIDGFQYDRDYRGHDFEGQTIRIRAADDENDQDGR